MTLREFIEQEIENGNVLDIADFGTHLNQLEFCDGEELDTSEYKDYLDHDLEWVTIKYGYGKYASYVWYEIELAEEKE